VTSRENTFGHIRELLYRQPPPLVMRFLRMIGQGINHHAMVGADDRVLLSVSGGKDSLAVALGLKLRLRYLPITYRLEAAMINWREHPHSPEALDRIQAFFDALEVPLTVLTADMKPDSFGGRFDCYRCGRNRRRILFDHVRGWTKFPLIATGHHLDDIVQTTLMNMFFRGSFSTMRPVQPFFGDTLRVIRPMCEVREEIVEAVARDLRLPVSTIDCPFRTKNIRSRIRPLIEEAARINPRVRENINRSHTNINEEYLPEL
jgi:tRNA 2-thiocytidine biosynthesis protein TtcA